MKKDVTVSVILEWSLYERIKMHIMKKYRETEKRIPIKHIISEGIKLYLSMEGE